MSGSRRSWIPLGGVLAPMLVVLISLTRGPTAADAPSGDPTRGAALFQACAACHSAEPGVHLTGPSLAATWNRRAGTVPGFGRYSEALKHAGITWDAATLDRWLERRSSEPLVAVKRIHAALAHAHNLADQAGALYAFALNGLYLGVALLHPSGRRGCRRPAWPSRWTA